MSVRNILDGTIKVGSGEVMPVEPEIPENLQVTTLKASDYVTGGSIYATDSLTVGTSRGKTTINTTTVTATNVAAESLTLGGNQVLTVQTVSDKMTVTGVKADGKTAVSFESNTNRWMHTVNSGLHVVIMVLKLTTEPLSQITIPTGLTCEKGANTWAKTLLKTNDGQFLYCVMQLNEANGKLVIKIDIPTANTYTSFQGRIATTFY